PLAALPCTSCGLCSPAGRSRGDPRAYTFNPFLGLAAFSLLLIPVAEIVAPGALSIKISGNGLGLALFMGMISTSLSYVLWHLTLRRIKASQGGIVQLVVPVLASLMGIGLLGERLTVTL